VSRAPGASIAGSAEEVAAAELGRIAALAAAGQRDLLGPVAAFSDLFAAKPFDQALFASVALATACNAPWCTAAQLRVANWSALWVFAADWRLDYLARSAGQIEALAATCLSAARGEPAGDDPLAGLLGAIRDELAGAAAFDPLAALWCTELERMFAAAAREWTWKSARVAGADGALPSLDAYLDGADNTGLAFVNVGHWISTGDASCLAHLDQLVAAGRAVQRVLRLVNDLATHDRDVRWGDLNALLLGVDRAEVRRRLGILVRDCRRLLRPLEIGCPREARYLARQMGFVRGFYRQADFWGSL
jgi:hypothetical protein